eukprot:CAMPEP_0204271820 /NCGR_PEP_ID=MMETSP0468-20130131/21183_1 /ASSEMBLY_ACC=CAM_ASM_000383 /TAXON_ID=2969 /ORGANISM="Oxyrrhis marina" /LENGTH=367 /DNA_ID=CAMNT_0051247575 /DNA_START=62 /DNA_END=1162 /DNA_ORIENTATION=-
MEFKRKKTRSKQKNLRKDTRSEDVKNAVAEKAQEKAAPQADRDKCFHCNQYGHWATQCPTRPDTGHKPDDDNPEVPTEVVEELQPKKSKSKRRAQTKVQVIEALEAETDKAGPDEEEQAEEQPAKKKRKKAKTEQAAQAAPDPPAPAAADPNDLGVPVTRDGEELPQESRGKGKGKGRGRKGGVGGPRPVVFMGQLHGEVDEAAIKHHLEDVVDNAQSAQVRMLTDRRTGEFKRSCFVDLPGDMEDVHKVVSIKHRSAFWGRRINVEATQDFFSGSKEERVAKAAAAKEAQKQKMVAYADEAKRRLVEESNGLFIEADFDEGFMVFLRDVPHCVVDALLEDLLSMKPFQIVEEGRSAWLTGVLKKHW